MGITGILLSVGVNLILLSGAYLILSRKISRQGSSEYILGNVRAEVSEMITELNQTADRNIGLLEARLARLQETIDKADSRLTLLRKETDKHSKGSATYSSVRPHVLRASSAPAVDQQDRQGRQGHKAAAKDVQEPSLFSSYEEAAGGGGHVPAANPAGSRGSSLQEKKTGNAAQGRTAAGSTGPGTRETGGPSAAGDRGRRDSIESKSSSGSGADQTSAGGGSKTRKSESAARPDKRAKVIELHRQGISPEVIASRVDSTIGEVELIITMAEGRGK